MIDAALLELYPNIKYIINHVPYIEEGVKLQYDEDLVQSKILELKSIRALLLLRKQRDRLIAKTDWRATVDYPGTDQEAWLTYRQALRDLPSTQTPSLDENGNLINVTWPEEPV